MPIRRSTKSIVYWLVLSPLMVLILFPFAVMISTALKPADEVYSFPPRWMPSHLVWSNFSDMWTSINFGVALWNTVIVSLCATLLCILLAFPVAYVLSRRGFPGRSALRQFLVVTQMLPPIILIIGLFRLMAAAGMIDQLWSLVITYAAFNLAFTVWMLESYIDNIPLELEEAALIDGARWYQLTIHVLLPLAAPAIGVTAIFSFVTCWNEFVLALTFLRSPEKLTLTMRVFLLVTGAYTVHWQIVMAAALATALPAAAMFAVVQRFLVRGLAIGAVK
jgi:multiple sugar transport system permease protein